MTQLELVISEIEKLPPEEQNQFVAWILEELHSEERWSKSFEDSSDVLSHFANEAVEEYKAKKTQKLDPDTLRTSFEKPSQNCLPTFENKRGRHIVFL